MKPTKTCTNCCHSVMPKVQTSPPGMLICMKPTKRPRKNVLMVHPDYASVCKCRSYEVKEEMTIDEQ